MIAQILRQAGHRPWPLPSKPWVMAQSWHELLFAHWAVPLAAIRPQVPATLSIDTFEGRAWLGIVPFRMTGVRLRFTPALSWFSAFPELNVRTYVSFGGKPGVWFFSLDAANSVAVAAARAWFGLPYFRARMDCVEKNGWIQYRSERRHRGAPPAVLRATYRPQGNTFHAQPGSLEHFLTERYCLYAAKSAGRIYRGDIHHPPWALQAAEAEIGENSMAEGAGLKLPAERALLHFARRQDMVAWAPERVL
jgi:uncharacterized protein